MLQTVLIVDDSMPLHALVKMQLQPDCLNVLSAYDGETAVSTAASLMPDLILLDVDMPHMDGFEACRQIKANPKTRSIPLIFLSADAIPADKLKGIGLGAVDYIVKPFKPEQLMSRVRSSLQPVPAVTDPRMVDAATGLGNDLLYEGFLIEQVSSVRRTAEPLSCIVVEIDQLASINSKYGIFAGNQVARRVASLLAGGVETRSQVFCLSNRRYAILSSGMDRFAAVSLSKRLQKTVQESSEANSGGMPQVTCSFGICDLSIARMETLLDRASSALDRAVGRGGNYVSMARSHANVKLAA